MRSGPSSVTLLDQANNPCSTIEVSVGELSLMRPSRSCITSLDQQSLSQALIELIYIYIRFNMKKTSVDKLLLEYKSKIQEQKA